MHAPADGHSFVKGQVARPCHRHHSFGARLPLQLGQHTARAVGEVEERVQLVKL